MNSKSFLKLSFTPFLLLVIVLGCASQVRVVTEPPPLPEGVMNARWGTSVETVKKAIDMDGNRWFQDDTDKPPYALYASCTYFDAPAILSYFFTPKSKKLYRVDVTFNDLMVYESAKEHLIQKLKKPTFSQANTDVWSWEDSSLVIFQKDSTHVQISYSSGPLLRLNHQEGDGLLRK